MVPCITILWDSCRQVQFAFFIILNLTKILCPDDGLDGHTLILILIFEG